MGDRYEGFGPGVSGPAVDGAAVTPSDATVIDTTRAIFVGGAGNLTVRMKSGNNVTFTAVSAGTLLPIRADRVLATGTTATSIVALY